MLQTFDSTASPDQGPPRLAALRRELTAEGLAGFLVPRADAHQGEYVAAHDERLAWLTGFTGSAGFCAALTDIAGVFIDGRYRVQVKSQVAADFTPVPWPETQLADWLKEQLPDGGTVGYDPWLHTVREIDKLTGALAGSGIALAATENLVDRIWADQPPPPMAPARVHDLDHAGESHADKRARLAGDLRGAGQAAAVITLPDSLCWLLNIRGGDVPRTPLMHGFAILHDDARVDLFAEAGKLTELGDHLTGAGHASSARRVPVGPDSPQRPRATGPRHCAGPGGNHLARRGRRYRPWRRAVRAAQSLQERRRNRWQPPGPYPRRRPRSRAFCPGSRQTPPATSPRSKSSASWKPAGARPMP